MSQKIEVRHKGVTVRITVSKTVKNGVSYDEFVVPDYTSGKRVRHVRATAESAKTKAKEICEVLAGGMQDVLEWSESLRDDIRQALKLLTGTRTSLDKVAHIFMEACRLVGRDEILTACHYWRDHRPSQQLTPKQALDAVEEFLDARRGKMSGRRHRTNTSYLRAFAEKFCVRNMHEITALEIEDWANGKAWSRKTRNDCLGTISLLFKYGIRRGFAAVNPADTRAIVREKLRGSKIEILMPDQAQRILNFIDESLRPFLAVWMFSGARKEEAARLTWEQVNAGLASGSIHLRADQSKVGLERSLPVSANLRTWLVAYRKPSGLLLPREWQGETEIQSMQRLDHLAKHIHRKTGVVWIPNGPRHSFATFHLKLHGDPAATVKAMGTSLAKLDSNYASRADTVTDEVAARWFAIEPQTSAQVISLLQPESEGEGVPKAPATAAVN